MSIINKLFSIKASESVADIVMPLYRDGISGFTHDITFGKGQISLLSDRKDLLSFYLKKEFPVICCNEDGRMLKSGVYLNQKLDQDYEDYSKLYPVVSKEMEFSNTIHIIEREESYQHLYSFTFSLCEIDFQHYAINNINKLKLFIRSYKFKAKDIIHEVSLPKNRVSLPFCGKQKDNISLFSKYILKDDLNEKFSVIHKDTYKKIILSLQQMKCLILLVEGNTSKMIASKLSLSSRTVDHYLTQVRKVLGCRTGKEMIVAYYSQIKSKF